MARPTTSRSYRSLVRDVILERGWCIQIVTHDQGHDAESSVGQGRELPFAYTIGLTRYHGHPEIITFNLCLEHFLLALNLLGEAVVQGHDVTRQEVLDRLFGERCTRMLRVADSSRHLVMANAMYRAAGADPIPALQLVWPDRQGRFPGQPGYSGAQPMLGEAA